MYITRALMPALLLMAATACAGTGKTDGKAAESEAQPTTQILGAFNADSAYSYIARQVAFGPRVPGTEAHDACRDFLAAELQRHGADTVFVQKGSAKAFTGDVLPISNIFASFNRKAPRRVLLAAHYDTRPWADRDHTMEGRRQPIAGANDGGSGVGVILEIARNLALKAPTVGVDILLTDVEDYGDSEGFGANEDTWCLGTQYWTANMTPYAPDALPAYGILLDMVGGRNARFHFEAFSHDSAPAPTAKVWSEAQRLGLSHRFIPEMGGAVTDDHVFLTRAGIPTVDIIETLNEQTTSFPPTWHTHDDNMDNIDRSSLADVGNTVLNVIYKEKAF